MISEVIEIVPETIENTERNAIENKVDNTEFIAGEAEKVIPKLISEGVRAHAVGIIVGVICGYWLRSKEVKFK